MKQLQKQEQRQQLALSQEMLGSLDLLQMSTDDALKSVVRETKRNPFISVISTGSSCPNNQSSDHRRHDEYAYGSEISFQDELIEQIELGSLNANHKAIGLTLVYCLDERGFLPDTAAEISDYTGYDAEEIVAVVDGLQSFIEPKGAFAWSLSDCLAIQLKAKGLLTSHLRLLIDHLDLVAKDDFVALAKLLNVSETEVIALATEVRKLNPFPASHSHSPPESLRGPEIVFVDQKDAQLTARLNDQVLPQLLVNDDLYSNVKAVELDNKAIRYYKRRYDEAAGFVLAMQKRANTLLKIAQLIAIRQSKFIKTGVMSDRKPLTMAQLARLLGMHKSTVSRALKGVFCEGFFGSISSREFFVTSLNTNSVEKTREQALKRLELLIRCEPKESPFSDEQLSQQMSNLNLSVSRRTVARLRAVLGIPGTSERKISSWR